MKYIRTKGGKIWSFSNPNNNFLYEGSDTKNGKWLHEIGEVVKEADSIEGLCDYALYEERGIQQVKKFPEECDIEFIRDLFLRGLVNNLKFAVLTNDGIINKAKMNAKGELELL